MSDIDTLRRAAALIRERTAAVTPGPWVTRLGNVEHHFSTVGEYGVIASPDEPHAEHIASWHPGVALAVADWLERVADDEPSWSYAHAQTEAESALAVARVYLAEDT